MMTTLSTYNSAALGIEKYTTNTVEESDLEDESCKMGRILFLDL